MARTTSSEAPLLVSVVVPVRDRSRDLHELVEALAVQTLPRHRFEVLIGDDGSAEDPAGELATADGWVRVLPGPPLNSYAARNRAARMARAPVLAFVDSDCKPEPGWLESGLAALADADAAAGRIRFSLPERRTVWTLIDMETTKDHESQVKMGYAETANLFVPRDLFERLGGFDDSLPEHGDFDFAQRLSASGARLVYAGEAVVWHPTRTSARSFLRMIWIMHRWYAAREVRAGRRPLGLTLRWWTPLVVHVRWRRRSGRMLRLDRPWLGQHGVAPRLADDALAMPIMYVFLPYFEGLAQLRGWWDGRRRRAGEDARHERGR